MLKRCIFILKAYSKNMLPKFGNHLASLGLTLLAYKNRKVFTVNKNKKVHFRKACFVVGSSTTKLSAVESTMAFYCAGFGRCMGGWLVFDLLGSSVDPYSYAGGDSPWLFLVHFFYFTHVLLLSPSAMCLPVVSFPIWKALPYLLFIVGVKLASLSSVAIQLTSKRCKKCPSFRHYCGCF